MTGMLFKRRFQFVPSMFIAQEPQTASRQERQKVSVEPTLFLIRIGTSRTIRPAVVEVDTKKLRSIANTRAHAADKSLAGHVT